MKSIFVKKLLSVYENAVERETSSGTSRTRKKPPTPGKAPTRLKRDIMEIFLAATTVALRGIWLDLWRQLAEVQNIWTNSCSKVAATS